MITQKKDKLFNITSIYETGKDIKKMKFDGEAIIAITIKNYKQIGVP